ncbi:MAG: hypothetical protein AAB116_08085 [Candidatus Poribacteria bacterium]
MKKLGYNLIIRCAIIVGLFTLFTGTLWASETESEHSSMETTGFHLESANESESQDMSEGHHAFVHPFFTHMGMPEGPGEIAVRTSAIQQAYEPGESNMQAMATQEASGDKVSRDLALHIETGLYNRVGLHLRSDSIKANVHSEIMLQYAVLQNKHADSGISTFVELEFPTNYLPEDEDKVVVELGVSGRKIFGKYGIVDAGIHYAPQESMVALEASGVLRLTPTIFPIIEGQVEKEGDEDVMANLLLGIKMRLKPGAHIGVGIQFPLTDARSFDNRAFVQLESAF